MSETFRFEKYTVDVTIEDKTYTLDASIDAQDYIKETAKDLMQMASDFKEGKIDGKGIREQLFAIVDHLLGAGSARKMFAKSKQPIQDAMDVCQFLFRIAGEYGRNLAKKMTVEN